MALFSSNLKKMQNELMNSAIDWEKIVNLSSGKYDLSGKNSSEGRKLIISLIEKAAEKPVEEVMLSLIIRNIGTRGGDFNRSMNPSGITPIHFASKLDDSYLLKALLQAGIQPASTTLSGLTALHVAVQSGNAESVKLLITAGADPGAEDSQSNAPLHFVMQLEDPDEIVAILLVAGAKAYHRNLLQKTSVDLAEELDHKAALKLLRESLISLRRNTDRKWNCPDCGYPIKRPSKKKVEWYLSLDMWDFLQFTCGQCGSVTPATILDGEI